MGYKELIYMLVEQLSVKNVSVNGKILVLIGCLEKFLKTEGEIDRKEIAHLEDKLKLILKELRGDFNEQIALSR